MLSVLVPALLASSYALAQGNGAPPVITTTDAATATTSVGASQKSATSALKLAKKYTVNEFLNDFDFFDDADPTNGYVNYVSKSDAQSLGLVSEVNGRFIMAADSTSRSIGRGRNSVRISSKAQWADGVYILDLNHMPVGCGTWPAFWTVVKDGWPKGGEIDIMEGANTYPSLNSNSYSAIESVGFQNASAGYPTVNNVASLHTSSQCYLNSNAYMTGTVGANTCSAYENGNTGCGVIFGGKSTYGTTSFGSGVNDAGGGWFAMWRDLENSGGVYIYYWPRNATNIPDDVTNADTQTTNVADWGQPGANLTVPCSSDFDNHVIVFNIAFCGDYAGNTYTQSGCPQTCQTFVQNYPAAFGEAYWSINSLRVYTASGKPASTGSGLSGGAIAGIVIGVLAGLALLIFGIWRYRRNRNARRMFAQSPTSLDTPTFPQSRKQSTAWAGLDDSELLTASALHEPKKKHSIASFISGNSDSVPTSRRGSRSGSVAGAAYSPSTGARLATKKARTGRTVLRPGMTAQNFLDGETPIGGAEEREDDPVQMGGFVMKPKSTPGWAG